MLTTKYLDGVPADSRMAEGSSLSSDWLTDQNLTHIRALNDLAKRRGQSLAQMALAWCLRDPRVTSLVAGASSVKQLEENLAALQNSSSRRTNWPRSIGTPSRAASTSGAAAARPNHRS